MSESVSGAQSEDAGSVSEGGWGGPDGSGFSDALGGAESGWGGGDAHGSSGQHGGAQHGAAQHGDAGSHISADVGTGWGDGGAWDTAPTPTPAAPTPETGNGADHADLTFQAAFSLAALTVPTWSGPYGQVDEAADWLIAPDGALLVPLRPDSVPNEALLVPAGGPLTPVAIMGATLIYRVGERLYRLVRPGLPRVLDPQVMQPLADPSQLQPLNLDAARRLMQFLENPPPGHVLHHIVPWGGPIDAGRDAGIAQRRLAELNIGPHDVEVLMWVPEGYHRGMHDQEYYELVNNLIGTARDRAQALERLADLRKLIEARAVAWGARQP